MKKVMVGGVFNAIHPGHEYFINKASEFGDYLIIVIATDRTVMQGKGYLLKKQEERKILVERLSIASKVIIGEENDFIKTVINEKPDIIVLGYDQKLDEDMKKKIESMGIRIERIDKKFGDYSTSKIAHMKDNEFQFPDGNK